MKTVCMLLKLNKKPLGCGNIFLLERPLYQINEWIVQNKKKYLSTLHVRKGVKNNFHRRCKKKVGMLDFSKNQFHRISRMKHIMNYPLIASPIN